MDRHLVAVKVRIVCSTNQRVNLDRPPFYQDRFKSLDPQAVQCGSPVKKHRMIFDYIFEDIPNFGADLFHHPFGTFDVVCQAVIYQAFHYERFKQLQGHLFGQPALIKF